MQNQRNQAAEKLNIEVERRAGISPEREFTKEDRVQRHRKFLETQKGLSPGERTVRWEKDPIKEGQSQHETEEEELVQVV